MFGSSSSKWNVSSNDTIDEGKYIQHPTTSDRPYSINRTYHGQTKHSERQSIYAYESFNRHFRSRNDDHDDENDDDYEEKEECEEEDDKFDCMISKYYPRNQDRSHDFNNNQPGSSSSRYGEPAATTSSTRTASNADFRTLISMSSSNENFNDLFQEFDRFELELQSMNSS